MFLLEHQGLSVSCSNKLLIFRNSLLLDEGCHWQHATGILQQQCKFNVYHFNFHILHTFFSRRLVGWWNTAAVRTAAVFSQMRCFCRIPTALQRVPRPYCAILGIISVCVPDPRQEEMKHIHPVVCRREEQLALQERPGPTVRDKLHATDCRAAAPAFSFPPGERKITSTESPSETKKPLSLCQYRWCNINVSLQTSVVLRRAKHCFSLPFFRISQESWQQFQRLMWQLHTFTVENPDISLLSN